MKLSLLLAAVFVCASTCFGQTSIQDTIFDASGRKWSGVLVVQPTTAFTAADGHFVSPQPQRYTISSGVVNLSLEPTDTAFPPGVSYSIEVFGQSGEHRAESWYVPTSATPLKITDVRASSRTLPMTAVPLSALAHQGATAGQGIVFNGNSWGPGTVSGSGSALIQKGALLTADGTSQQTLSPGTDGTSLVADSAQTDGLTYALRELPLTFTGPLLRSGNSISAPTTVVTTGSYNDPAWIVTLNASKIVGSVGSAAMPIATASAIGAVKPGAGLQVDVAGVLTPQFGMASGSVMEGNDSRVLNALQSSNAYADPSWITSLGAGKLTGTINSANLPAATTTNAGASKPGTGLTGALDGTYSVNYGTTAGTAAQGNDSRITGAVQAGGSYPDPAWITSLSSAKIAGNLPYTQITGLATSATVDVTNAGNISSGTLGSARLPAPTTADLGGIKSLTCGAGHVSAIDITGTPVCTPDLGAVGTLLQANNLSDLSSVATSRINLGLGTSATHPVTDFLQPANNLSDIGNAGTTRTNLGLGSASTQSSTAFLQPGNNLSEILNAVTARANLGLPSTVTQDATNANNLTSGTVASARMPNTAVQTNGSATFGANTYDFSGSAHVMPLKVGTTAGKPATCTLGELYFASDASAGSNVYACTSSNVWTLETGGSGGGLLAANNLSDLSNIATSRTNLGLGTAALQASTAFLNTANNLSDIASVVTTRSNLGLVASATTDTTNAGNISAGTLPAGRLPNPSAVSLGGVQSLAATTHQFLTSIGTNGTPTAAQPAASDISGLATSATTDATNASNLASGTVPAARIPNPTASTLGGVQSGTAPSHQFETGISTLGVPTFAQPAAADVSGLANSATVDATNATNIASGTLNASRLPGTVLQSGANIALSGNTFDLSAESHTTPFKVGVAASKPATCGIGEMYFASDASPGSNIYLCTASNTWTLQSGSTGNGLLAANNLSDLSNIATSRTNLGLGTAALQSTSTFLQSASNLGDLPNPAVARSNLGLGAAALLSGALQPSSNLSDVASPSTSRTNLGLPSTVTQDATNASNLASGTVAVARLPGTVLQSGQNIALSGNTFDLSGESHTLPTVKGPGGSKPATCSIGEQYFATDASAGQNLFLCTSTNTWTQVSGGSTGLQPANNLSDVSSVVQSRLNLGLGTASTQASTAFLQASNSLSDLGSLTAARTNLGLSASAVTDTTNASNITAGTLNFSRLPALSTASLTDNVQIQRTNTSNTITNVAAPSTPSAGTLSIWSDSTNKIFSAKNESGTISTTVVPSVVAPHQFVNGLGNNGLLSSAQPVAADITGLASSATIDTTSANNIVTGTLGAGRLPTSVVQNTSSVQWLAGVTVDASFAAHTLPMKTGITSNKPSSCIVGEEYFATDALAGQNLYYCTATNIWTQQVVGNTGTNGALLAANNLSDLPNPALGRANLGLSAWVLTDTTNASNLSSGVLPAARLPVPTSTTLGGVKSLICGTGHIASIDTTGTPTCTADSGGGTSTAINGTTVPTNNAANTLLLTTAPATAAWAALLNCPDTAGQHLNYNSTTHAFSCGVTGGTGSPALSSISYTGVGTGATTMTALAKMQQTVNVMDYGAKCDGATVDNTAFTNAMNQATVVMVPPNVTCVIDGLTPATNTTLRGSNGSRLLKTPTTPADYMFNISFSDRVTIENLILDLNGNTQASAATPMLIGTQSATNVKIRSNLFQNSGTSQTAVGGINFWSVTGRIEGNTFANTIKGRQIRVDTSASTTNRIEVYGNTMDGSQSNAIEIINSSGTEAAANVEVAENVITNVGDSAADQGQTGNAIDVFDVDYVSIHHNHIDSSIYSGVRIATANFADVHDNWINNAKEVSIWCGEIGGAGNNCHHNYIQNYVGGIQDTNVSSRTIDTPNKIENNQLVNGSDYGIHAEHAVVIGNIIDGNPFPITVGYGGTTHNNVVQNNRILRSSTNYPNVAVGIAVDTNLNTGTDVISGNSIEGTPAIAGIMGANFTVQWTVTAITKAATPTVSFTAGSAPVAGSTVCFAQIPGMTQLNGQCATVSSPTFGAGSGTMTININTSTYSTFALPSSPWDLSPRFFPVKFSSGAPVYGTPSTMLITNQQMTFGILGNAANGSQVYVTDGTPGASCSGSGTGASAVRIAGVWTCAQGSTGGSGTPGGSTGQVQFNAAGAFGGDGGFTYNNGTQVVTANGGFVSGGSATGSTALTDSVSNNTVTVTPTASTTASYTLSLPKAKIAATTSTVEQYSTGTPTAVWGTGAGTSPTSTSVGGNNSAFNIAFTAGSSPAAGTIGTFTFSQAFSATPVCIAHVNGTAITGLGWTATTTTLAITDTSAVTASTAYKITAMCSGNQ